MEFECRGILDHQELYELIPVLSHHAAQVVPLLHSYSTWNDIESAVNIGNDGEPFFPEIMTITPVPGTIHSLTTLPIIHSLFLFRRVEVIGGGIDINFILARCPV